MLATIVCEQWYVKVESLFRVSFVTRNLECCIQSVSMSVPLAVEDMHRHFLFLLLEVASLSVRPVPVYCNSSHSCCCSQSMLCSSSVCLVYIIDGILCGIDRLYSVYSTSKINIASKQHQHSPWARVTKIRPERGRIRLLIVRASTRTSQVSRQRILKLMIMRDFDIFNGANDFYNYAISRYSPDTASCHNSTLQTASSGSGFRAALSIQVVSGRKAK